MNKSVRELTVGIDETDPLAVGFVKHFTATVDSATRSRQFMQVSSEGSQVWCGTIAYGENKANTVAVTLLVGPANLLAHVDFRVQSSRWFDKGFSLGRKAFRRCKALTLDSTRVEKGRLLIMPSKHLPDSLLRCAANEFAARLTRPDPTYQGKERRHRPRNNPRPFNRINRSGSSLVGVECPPSIESLSTPVLQLAIVAS